MWLNIGLSFFIHLLIVLTAFFHDFLMEIWQSPLIRYGIILSAILIEVIYFIVLSILRTL